MNGEHGEIYNLMTDIQKNVIELRTIEELHHEENRKDLNRLFEGAKKLTNLPCEVHFEHNKNQDKAIAFSFTLIVIILGWLALS